MRTATYSAAGLREATQAFRDYVGVKLHFNQDLVWTPDKGLRLSEDQLLARRDTSQFFLFISKFKTREERLQRLVSLFVNNRDAWIGDVFGNDARAQHAERMKTVGTIRRTVTLDTDAIRGYMDSCQLDIRTLLQSDGVSPYIHRCQNNIVGGVTTETMSLLEKAFRFCHQPASDLLWEQRALLYSKYHHWIVVDNTFLREQFSKLTATHTAIRH